MKSAHGYEECSPRGATSLDAQRESAEAYVQSQASEGWVCLRDRYDDGGFTGSNSDRPGLRRLLTDIEAGKIDAVLVYKVDRLSRSLLDFAGMIRLFDDHDIAFVSVTQQFNTGSSMGRLSEFVQRGAKAIPSVTEAEFHALGDWFAVNENALRAIMHPSHYLELGAETFTTLSVIRWQLAKGPRVRGRP